MSSSLGSATALALSDLRLGASLPSMDVILQPSLLLRAAGRMVGVNHLPP